MPAADPRIAALEERTREILERGERAPDREQVEREKAAVREARYLLRLLAIRRRSEGELRERLRVREVPAAIAHEAVERVRRAELIDDAAFAAEWVRQRRIARGLADAALRRELETREVASAHIEAALALDDGGEGHSGDHGVAGGAVGAAARETGEERRCRELVRARLRRERLRTGATGMREGDEQWRATARRLDAYLARRGYSGAMAVHVISTEMRTHAQG